MSFISKTIGGAYLSFDFVKYLILARNCHLWALKRTGLSEHRTI